MTHDTFYACFRSNRSSRCDSTSSLLSFFISSLQAHPCFLSSIFPETEEALGWNLKFIISSIPRRQKRLWCPLVVGRGIGHSPTFVISGMTCRTAANVTGGVFLWFFVSKGFNLALKDEQSKIPEGMAGICGSNDRASIDTRPSVPPSIYSIRCSLPITHSRSVGWTASKLNTNITDAAIQ